MESEMGNRQDQTTLLGGYLYFRHKALLKNSELRKKVDVFKKMSERDNFVHHYMQFMISDDGKRLRSKSAELYEIFKKGICFDEKRDFVRESIAIDL
jgi:hypothetical protein